MLISIWLFFIFLGFIIKNSKIITILQLLFATLMITFNNNNPDQLNYITTYFSLKTNSSLLFNQNPIFNFLLYIFGVFNNYNVALCCIVIISFYFLYKGISFYTDNTSFVISLYLISPFVIDGTQIKNFVAMCIWIYFSTYLFKATKDHKFNKNAVIYLLGVLITTMIHFSFMFTVLYILVIFLDFTKLKNICLSIISIVVVLLGLLNLTSLLQNLGDTGISSFQLASLKLNDYAVNYDSGSASARFKVTVLFYVLIAVIFILIYKNIIYIKSYYTYIIKITIMSLLILSIISYSMEMYRLQRNLLILYYIMFAMSLDNNGSFLLKNIKISTLSLLPAIFYLYFDSIIWNYDSVFRVMFHL